jgi:hypothetical protein
LHLLLIPEFAIRCFSSAIGRRQAWNSLCQRLTLSWLAFLFCRFAVESLDNRLASDGGEVSPTLMELLRAYRRSRLAINATMNSPHGLVGICAAVSCASTGLWLMTRLFIYGGSISPPTKSVAAAVGETSIHNLGEAIHLLVVCCLCRAHGTHLSDYLPHFVFKVLTYHAAMRAFVEAESVLTSPTGSSSSNGGGDDDDDDDDDDNTMTRKCRMRAAVVYLLLFCWSIGLQHESVKRWGESKLAAWLTFQTSLIAGLILSSTVEQVGSRLPSKPVRDSIVHKLCQKFLFHSQDYDRISAE